MKTVKTIILIAVVALLSFGIYNLWTERSTMQSELETVQDEFNELRDENRSLQAQIRYFENPKNLVEEAKKNFNFREEGENLMIIVPDSARENSSNTN